MGVSRRKDARSGTRFREFAGPAQPFPIAGPLRTVCLHSGQGAWSQERTRTRLQGGNTRHLPKTQEQQ